MTLAPVAAVQGRIKGKGEILQWIYGRLAVFEPFTKNECRELRLALKVVGA